MPRQTFPPVRRVAPGVDLLCVCEPRFKRALLEIHVEVPLDGDSPARTLLVSVLEQGSAGHPSRLALARALQEAWGADLDLWADRNGEVHRLTTRVSWVGESLLPPGADVVSGLLPLAREVWEAPRRGEDGRPFRAEVVEREREHLVKRIRSLRDDRAAWAEQRFLAHMCADEPYGRPPWGDEAAMAAVTGDDLERVRLAALSGGRVLAVAVGPVEEEPIEEFLAEWFRDRAEPPPLPAVVQRRPGERREVREELPGEQARFHYGFRCPLPEDEAGREALLLGVSVLGGGVHSRLFRKVREERSLAYGISARLRSRKGLLTVAAGIQAEHADEVRDRVDAELADLRRAGPAQEELDHARRQLEQRLVALSESPGALAAYLVREEVLGLRRAPEDRRAALRSVTPAAVAAELERPIPDTVYLLAPTQP